MADGILYRGGLVLVASMDCVLSVRWNSFFHGCSHGTVVALRRSCFQLTGNRTDVLALASSGVDGMREHPGWRNA